jgi:hypothetical protein
MQKTWVSVEGLAKEQKKLQDEANKLIQPLKSDGPSTYKKRKSDGSFNYKIRTSAEEQQLQRKNQQENREKRVKLREERVKLLEDFLYEDVDLLSVALLLSSARSSAQPSVTQKSQSTLRTQDSAQAKPQKRILMKVVSEALPWEIRELRVSHRGSNITELQAAFLLKDAGAILKKGITTIRREMGISGISGIDTTNHTTNRGDSEGIITSSRSDSTTPEGRSLQDIERDIELDIQRDIERMHDRVLIKIAVTLEFSRMLRRIEVAQEGLEMPQVILLLTSSVGLEIALLRR